MVPVAAQTGKSGLAPDWARYAGSATDVLYVTDQAGVVRWISPSVTQVLGWTPEELIGKTLADRVHVADRDRIAALRESFYADKMEHSGVTCMLATAEHGYREVTLSGRPLIDDQGRPSGAIITFTDTHDSNAALRALTTLSQANRLVVRASDEIGLLRAMCHTIVETGRYSLAWYGRPVNDAAKSVEVTASAGDRAGYLDDLQVSPPGRGPIGRCLRTGIAQVQNELQPDPDHEVWSQGAGEHGFRSSISLPVVIDGELDGALNVYATESFAFDAVAQQLLENLATDLGFGLGRLRANAAAQRFTETQVAQRLLLTATINSVGDPLVVLEAVRDPDGRLQDLRYTQVNTAAAEYLLADPEDLAGSTLMSSTSPRSQPGPVDAYFRTIETGSAAILDDFRPSGGDRRYDIRATRCGDGVALTWRDVTDRHRSAQELLDSERRYRMLAEHSSDVILLTGSSAVLEWVSASTLNTLGWHPEDMVGRNCYDFLHPDDRLTLATAIEQAGPDEVVRMRQRWRRQDGCYLWMETIGTPFGTGEDGAGRLLSLRDVDEQVQAEQDLAERERLYRLLAENSSDVVFLNDEDTTLRWVSLSVTEVLGWQPEDLVGRSGLDFLHPDDVPGVRRTLDLSLRTGEPARYRYRWRRPDGGYRWMEGLSHALQPGENPMGQRVHRMHQIDDQVRAEEALAAREQRYRLLAENASDVVWEIGPDVRVTWTSPSVERVLGWRPDQVAGRAAIEFIHPEDRARATLAATARTDESEGRFRLLHADGTSSWMALTLHDATAAAGEVVGVLSMRDVDAEMATRQRLAFALDHDQLTGLATRKGITARLVPLLRAATSDHRVAVLYVGMDSLAEINEGLGHVAGDLLLATVAGRIARAFGTDAVGRGAGDEFVVVLPDIVSSPDAADAAERIRDLVRQPVDLGSHQVAPTVSIGVAVGDDADSAEHLLRDAALAMRTVKDSGRDRFAFVDPSMAVEAERQLAVERQIRVGLAQGEFVPWFQPIVTLRDGILRGYEVLARWHHDGEFQLPAVFLPVAARSALITEIDLAMVEQAVGVLAERPELGFISLNVTPATLERSPYADAVRTALKRHDVAPQRIHLEVTETMLLTLNDPVTAQIELLARMGCRWYVDDFGTGFSSISHLRDLPIAGLKLDRSFTAGIAAGDDTSRQLASGLLGLANGLGLDGVAEGVETQAEAAFLQTLGWHHGQGWLYGKPAPMYRG